MIDIESEELLTFSRAAKYLPHGRANKPVHVATLHRWASSGASGVRLETVRIGGVRFTSKEALERFIERCTAGDPDTPIQTSKHRQREIGQAERELAEAGIG